MGGSTQPLRTRLSGRTAQRSVREIARQMVLETASFAEIARRVKERRGWRISEAAAVSRVSQWLSAEDPHELPAEHLDIVIDVCLRCGGHDYLTGYFLEVGASTRRTRKVKRGQRYIATGAS